MQPFVCSLFLLLLFGISGCSPVSVNYDFDNQVDFSAIRTYNWGESNDVDTVLAGYPLLKKRIISSIDTNLQAKGYVKVDPDQADILVVIHATLKEKTLVSTWDGPGGYYRDPWYDPWWGPTAFGGGMDVSYYEEGTLVVDIVDNRAKAKELIWRGLGSGVVQPNMSRDKIQGTVDQYVNEILQYFPPGRSANNK